MVKIEGRVEIDCSPAEAYGRIADPENWSQWWVACEAAKAADPELRTGTGLLVLLRPHKKLLKLGCRIAEHRPGQLLRFQWAKLGVRGEIRWNLIGRPKGRGCAVEERISLDGPGLFIFRAMGQVEALGYMVQRNLDGLKGFLEKG